MHCETVSARSKTTYDERGREAITSRIRQLIILGVLSLPVANLTAQPCPPVWDNTAGNPGMNSTVWSLAAAQEDTAVGPRLYVGGQFSTAGGALVRNIAAWDGHAWSPLGTGAQNGGTVHAIAVSNSIVYVGGAFGNMGGIPGTSRIAQWNGNAWSDVGGGMSQNNAGIRAFAFFQNNLYAGGFLNEIGGIVAHKLARWNGSAWSSLPGDPLGLTDVVHALTVYDDGGGEALYVGGSFNSAGGNANAANVFKWDGTTLQPLGRGANDDVEAFAFFNDELYCGGHFTQVTQTDGTVVAATKIAKWDGSAWSPVAGGLSNGIGFHVWSLAVFDDGNGPALFVGGQFNAAGSTTVLNIAKYDGTSWSEVGTAAPLNGQVRALAAFDDGAGQSLYVGGTFTTNVAQPADRITAWRSFVPRGTGDINNDGLLDGRDIPGFVDQVLLPDPLSNAHCAADINQDTFVTTADLPLFITALLGS